MGILIGFLRTAFGLSLGKLFGGEISNLTLLVSYSVAFLALNAVLFAAFKALTAAITLTVPDSFMWGLGFLPDNVSLCTRTIIDARVAVWVYQFRSGLLDKRTAMMKV